jgi:hypothetical protein
MIPTMRFPRFLPAAVVAVSTACSAFAGANDWPDWLSTASREPTPDYAAKAPAVVLLDDTSLEIDAHGVAIETHRYAVRILHLSGRDNASASTYYNGAGDKVLKADAWLLRDGKSGHPVERLDWVDLAANSPGAAIDELRSRNINLSSFAVEGDVFGVEMQVRGSLVVAQIGPFRFGQKLPVVTERLTVNLPPGFSLEAQLYGPIQPLAATPDSHTWTWTSSDRPYRPDEPFAAPGSRADAELFLGLRVPRGASGFAPRSFANWSEVAEMYDQLNSGQCDSSPELVAKVHEVTANCPDQLARIKAVAAYVQRVRYIEINEGLRHGFGWKARRASTVFSTGYGDCKDKANLLAAMLNAAGLHSHRVIALADPEEGRRVHPEFPSPVQFNHAILAIEVDNSVQVPAVVATEKWGRVLFFDPTDPYTGLGDLPFYLQGTKVHVAAAGNNSLTDLPVFAPKDDFLIERRAALSLSSGSNLTVIGSVTATGQSASELRHRIEGADVPEKLEHLVTTELSDSFRGATVQEKKADDDRALGRSTLTFTCFHPRFAQQIQGGATVVKLDVLSRHYLPNFSESTRALPVEIPPLMLRDQIVLDLGGVYTVDELPGKTSLNTAYGSYEISFALAQGSVVMSRTVLLNRLEVPATDYANLRKFFIDMARADRTSILLKRGA